VYNLSHFESFRLRTGELARKYFTDFLIVKPYLMYNKTINLNDSK
jgi:hypothetical protein